MAMRVSMQDVRLAARNFARHRAFTTVAVLSLALAISLNTTMYSVIDAMVRPKLAMREPDRLYSVFFYGDARRRIDRATSAQLLRSGFRTYEAATYIASGAGSGVAIERGNQFATAAMATIAPNYFQVLGVVPRRGRLFGEADHADGAHPIIITETLAEKLSPNAPLPIGAVLDVDGVPRPVIGTLGRGVNFSNRFSDVWQLPPSGVPLANLVPNVIRVRSNAKMDEVVAEFELLARRAAQLSGESPDAVRYDLRPMNRTQFRFASFHLALIAAVFAVLLVACANIANLQLARGISRGRELALRTALGASRRQLIAQLLLESALLSIAGLVAGLILTVWGTHLLSTRIPPTVAEYVIAPQITWRVFVFGLVASVLCTILIGLVPAIRVSRVDPNQLLKAGAGTGANRRNRRQYAAMVVLEIGLSLALLSGAALVVRTALRVNAIRIGYDPKPLAIATAAFTSSRDTVVSISAFFNTSLNRIRGVSGIASAAAYVRRGFVKYAVTVEERGGPPRERGTSWEGYRVVSPGYFRTFGRPILKGRDFLDGLSSEPEVIIDQHTARALWPGVDPIGLRIKLGEYKSAAPWARVVGVVSDRAEFSLRTWDVKNLSLREVGDIYYLPAQRDSMTLPANGAVVNWVVRASEMPARLPVALRRELAKSPGVRYAFAHSMEAELGIVQQRLRHDFVASLFALFALLAIGLAALGIHGIVAHSVAERTRELGVRIALGATSKNILSVVLREGNAVALAGVAVGLYLTKRSAGWLQAFTFEDDRYDAPLFAAMAAVIFVVAVLSALWPAVRATRVDPVESLRSE
jgi:putative ABC transport system permease protein